MHSLPTTRINQAEQGSSVLPAEPPQPPWQGKMLQYYWALNRQPLALRFCCTDFCLPEIIYQDGNRHSPPPHDMSIRITTDPRHVHRCLELTAPTGPLNLVLVLNFFYS